VATDGEQEIWRDPCASVAERVRDLMSKMTIEEKVGQLYGLWLGIDGQTGEVAPYQGDMATGGRGWKEALARGVGQLTRPYGTAPVEPAVGARAVAQAQGEIMAAGRFAIPALVHEECLTGVSVWKAPVYPSPLCWGATFDPELIERLGARIGQLMKRLGAHQGLAPVLDVVRDLRWGRTEETIGEDPYLVGTIGSAYVRGLESAGVVATLKHFVGYSASRSGRNLAPVSIGARELADVFLPPFEMALRSGARSVMNSYTDLDGVPVASDGALFTELLRGKYGFQGTVVSDYFAVAFLQKLHGVAGSPSEAAQLALSAGIDVELPMVDCYGQPLLDAVASGQVGTVLVDRALERVLRQKCELGLLDPDWSAEPPLLAEGDGDGVLDDEGSRQLAREIAQRSLVLMSNDGVLPLRPGLRVALVGPRADVAGAMLGDYSFPMHAGRHFPDVPMGVAVPTLRQVLAQDPAAFELSFAQGCSVTEGTDEEIAEAAGVAATADVCVAVLGDHASLFGGGTSGEGCDALDLKLPGRQGALLEALLGTGTPVVLILLVGRPYDLCAYAGRLAAAVCGFFPGEEGATAIADVISGRVNPSGRLPVSFPGPGGGQPGTYLGPALSQANSVSSVDPTPLFAFGHGLSYAPVTWLSVERRSSSSWPVDGTCEVAVALRNDGGRSTTEVVQVYLQDPVAEVARPARQLIGSARAVLPAGATRTVVFQLHADLTSYTGRAGHRQVDPGEVRLLVGASSVDIKETLVLSLSGPKREVGFERVSHPTVEIL
jgi:beta-glucosidase